MVVDVVLDYKVGRPLGLLVCLRSCRLKACEGGAALALIGPGIERCILPVVDVSVGAGFMEASISRMDSLTVVKLAPET